MTQPKSYPRVPFAQAVEDLNDICRYIDDGADVDAALSQTFNELKLDLADAVDRRVVFFQNLDGSIDSAIAACESWKREAERLESIKLKLMERTRSMMEAFPDLPYQGKFGRLKIVNNGGVQPLSVKANVEKKHVNNIVSEDELVRLGVSREYYKSVTYFTLINESIRKSIESGEKIEWAELLPRGKRVTWQTKT